MNPRLAIHRNRIPDGQNRSVIKRNLTLTAGGVRAIITAGRDDACAWLIPSVLDGPPYSSRWMAALLFYLWVPLCTENAKVTIRSTIARIS